MADFQIFFSPSRWFHVPTKSDPADIALRGSHAHQIINNQLWWNAPQVLKSPNQWQDKPREDAMEKRKMKLSVIYATPQ